MKNNFPVLDLHCDTASEILDGRTLYDNKGMLSIKKMQKGGVGCQFFAMYIKMTDFPSLSGAYEHLHKIYSNFMKELKENTDHLALARNAGEIEALNKEGKIAAVLTLEEGGVLDNKLERLDELYEMGLRLITVSWNYENCIGFPHSSENEAMNRGLKPFGMEVVKRMQELGMIIDVSHLSDGGFWDVVKLSKKPFVASHSNARSLCGHTRNLTDEMIKALADSGGVIGINFVCKFLSTGEEGTIKQMVDHIKHIHKLGGIDVLALGSDFDGTIKPSELGDCSNFPLLTDAIAKAGYSEDEIEKICWNNAMRVIKQVL
jgi:membrane dipeptidase